MTLAELQRIFPGATAETWHQHPNGGGWVENTALVSASALVSGDAQMLGDAQVLGDARVSGGVWDQAPLYIQGTRHAATASKKDHISIGCHEHTIAYWLKHYRAIGRASNYSAQQIREYGAYIRLFAWRYQPELLEK